MSTHLRKIVFVLFALLCVSFVLQRLRAVAQAPAAGGVFQRYDRNSDGKVTHHELLEKATFARFDVNKDGDGKISQREFHQLYKDADSYFSTRQREAQPADGRKLPDPLPVKADPLGLRFTQDYFPGTTDPQGRVMAATEANQVVSH